MALNQFLVIIDLIVFSALGLGCRKKMRLAALLQSMAYSSYSNSINLSPFCRRASNLNSYAKLKSSNRSYCPNISFGDFIEVIKLSILDLRAYFNIELCFYIINIDQLRHMSFPQQANPEEDCIILPQLGITNRIIKKHFPEKVVTLEFKKEFAKAVSLFILFTQNSIDKKKYGKQDILQALEKEGLGRVAQNLRDNKGSAQVTKAKQVVVVEQNQQMRQE